MPENDHRSPLHAPRIRPPATVTTLCTEAPYEGFHVEVNHYRVCPVSVLPPPHGHPRHRGGLKTQRVVKVQGLLLQGVISELSEHWTPRSSRAAAPRGARRLRIRTRGALRHRSKRHRHIHTND